MKIVHVIPSLGKGGAERYVADVCTELSTRDGVEVMIIVMNDVNHYRFLTEQLHVEITKSKVLPSVSGKSIIEISDYVKKIEAFDPDIIHSHLFHAELLTREYILPSAAYVTTCQNNMPEFANFGLADVFNKKALTMQFEKKWMIKRYRQCQNNFIVISKDTESYYRSTLPADLKSIHLLYHAIDFTRFYKAYHDRSGRQKIKLVFVGRFVEIKNHQFLVKVVARIIELGYQVECVMPGDGELRPKIQAMISEMGLEENVKLPGTVDEVENLLGEANVYVHPARYEPFGLVIIEAMAAGLPVVCLNGKGNRDLIENGVNGFMFDEEDPDVFAKQIIELFANEDLYKRISLAEIEYARGFAITQHVDKLLDLYKTFLDKRRTLEV